LSVPTLLIKFSIIIQWGGTIIFYNLLSKKYGYFDYVFIGDICDKHHDSRTKAQNYKNRTEPDQTPGIVRLTHDGKVIGERDLGNAYL
jgi:hypothetical protein